MMNDPAIIVENLSKRYRIGAREQMHDTFVGALTSFVRSPFRNLRRLRRLTSFRGDGSQDEADVIWALRDVSFEVQRGEVLGIIGKNGAGKSTLLKILSRITEPTSGRAVINGRVSSLLEVGTGFHPELTGRENIYLNGTILGMRKAEIDHKFDEIVDFSGVEKFIDTPVKFYSSGMRVRLAFSVAAHLEPEILLIDEVLAVGDAEFQKKCLGKMGEVAEGGRTVLFVSHNMGAINRLCNKSIFLNNGKIYRYGSTHMIVDKYLSIGLDGNQSEKKYSVENAPGDESIKLMAIRICQPSGKLCKTLKIDKPFEVEVETDVKKSISEIGIAIKVTGMNGQTIIHTADTVNARKIGKRQGRKISTCQFPPFTLNVGTYLISVGIDIPHLKIVCLAENILKFNIETGNIGMGRYSIKAWKGIIGPGIGKWNLETG